jgi:hypothetical protein
MSKIWTGVRLSQTLSGPPGPPPQLRGPRLEVTIGGEQGGDQAAERYDGEVLRVNLEQACAPDEPPRNETVPLEAPKAFLDDRK